MNEDIDIEKALEELWSKHHTNPGEIIIGKAGRDYLISLGIDPDNFQAHTDKDGTLYILSKGKVTSFKHR